MKTLELTDSLIKIMEICADIYNNDDDHAEVTADNAIVYNGHEFYVCNLFFNTVVIDGLAVELVNYGKYVINGEEMSPIAYVANLLAD